MHGNDSGGRYLTFFVGPNKRATALCANKGEAKDTDSRNIYQGKQTRNSYESAVDFEMIMCW